jgi:hypothetical protein
MKEVFKIMSGTDPPSSFWVLNRLATCSCSMPCATFSALFRTIWVMEEGSYVFLPCSQDNVSVDMPCFPWGLCKANPPHKNETLAFVAHSSGC